MRTLNSLFALLAIGVAAALLGGCASNPAPVVDRSLDAQTSAQISTRNGREPARADDHAGGRMTARGYRVVRGDTLYSIAFKHGVDYRALAARNDIAPPYVIHPGQILRIDSGGQAQRSTIANASTPPGPPPRSAAPIFETVPNTPVPGTRELPSVSPPVAVTGDIASASPNVAPMNPAAVTASESKTLPAIVAGRTSNVDGISWRWPADGAVISGFQNGGSGAGLDIAGNAGDPVRAAADGVVVYSGNGLIGYGELIIIKHSDSYLSAYGHNRKRLVQEGEHVRAGQLIAEMGSSGAPREELHFEIRKNGKPVDPTDYLPGR